MVPVPGERSAAGHMALTCHSWFNNIEALAWNLRIPGYETDLFCQSLDRIMVMSNQTIWVYDTRAVSVEPVKLVLKLPKPYWFRSKHPALGRENQARKPG